VPGELGTLMAAACKFNTIDEQSPPVVIASSTLPSRCSSSYSSPPPPSLLTSSISDENCILMFVLGNLNEHLID
jgi:hypothetical protein